MTEAPERNGGPEHPDIAAGRRNPGRRLTDMPKLTPPIIDIPWATPVRSPRFTTGRIVQTGGIATSLRGKARPSTSFPSKAPFRQWGPPGQGTRRSRLVSTERPRR
jgi:hypothetical protein